MEKSSIFKTSPSSVDKALPVPFKESVIILGTDNPVTILCKDILATYLHTGAIEVICEQTYGYNIYEKNSEHKTSIPNMWDGKEEEKERTLINIINEEEFYGFVHEALTYIPLSDRQDTFCQTFKGVKVINLVLLNDEVKTIDEKQLLGIDAINRIGRQLSDYRHSVVGVMHVDNLLNSQDVVINSLYNQPHDSLVKFDKDCNTTAVTIREFQNKVTISSLTF